MQRTAAVVLGLTLVVGPVLAATSKPAVAAPPIHSVTIAGAGLTSSSTWPSYDGSIGRFGVSTTAQTAGTLTVEATTSDPTGEVRVNGSIAPGGHTTVDGLAAGDEVNVQITDAAGTSNQSFVYLPPGFPTLTGTTTGSVADGQVFLTLGSFLSTTGYEAVVDAHGVPSFVAVGTGSADFRPTYQGYTIARRQPNGTTAIVHLDDKFRQVSSRQLDGIPASTDSHDSALLPDGRALLIGYHPSTHTSDGKNYLDAVIQLQDAQGHATWTWDSSDATDGIPPSESYVFPPVKLAGVDFADYAHINAVQLVGAHEDVLASFRNLSQVRLIATQAHDGHQPGDTIWTFGGAENDFTIKKGNGDPDPGPCAQHMARLLPNGDLTLFDNGSLKQTPDPLGGQTADMCENPADPTGPRIARPHTRVTEYSLDFTDPDHPVATLAWEYAPAHVYAAFAGSQQLLPDGHHFLGWSLSTDPDNTGAPQAIASEIDADGTRLWSLSSPGWFSYRAIKADAPDRVPPIVTLTGFTDGTSYDVNDPAPTVSYGCTDRGGSNLDQCSGTVPDGGAVPMAVGSHAVTVTATDLAGNVSTATLHYTVTGPPPPTPTPTPTPTVTPTPAPVYRPVDTIRLQGHPWRPNTVDVRLRAEDRATLLVRVRNGGDTADRFVVTAPGGGSRFAVSYRAAGQDVTGKVRRGLLTPELAPGATYVLRVVVARTPKAMTGDSRWLDVVAVSRHDAHARDAVAAKLIAK